MASQGLTLRLVGEYFAVLRGAANLVAEPTPETAQWGVAGAKIIDGVIRDLTHPPGPGRLFIEFEGLTVQRLADARYFEVRHHALVTELTILDLRESEKIVGLVEHTVVFVSVRDSAGRPVPDVELFVAAALSEPITFPGRSDANGELVVLAQSGYYSVSGGKRPVMLQVTQPGEQRVEVLLD